MDSETAAIGWLLSEMPPFIVQLDHFWLGGYSAGIQMIESWLNGLSLYSRNNAEGARWRVLEMG
jgi:hypothetical protein